MNEYFAHLGFSLFHGVGPKRFKNLIIKFDSAESAWEKEKEEMKESGISENLFLMLKQFRNTYNPFEYQEKLEKAEVVFIPHSDALYPPLLKEIPDPPIGLFVKGNLSLLTAKRLSIGVVGTRKMTSYGKEVTESLVSELVHNNIIIVSGLALGVDAAAHRKTVDCEGDVLAVLGCGVDCCSPMENYNLYQDIIKNGGCVISEYPLGEPPSKGSFPARNRIISGLSQGILVTEAGEDSGSLITAGIAVTQERKVFAVPGPITSTLSRGTLKLLRQGAKLVQTGDDILEEFEIKDIRQNTTKKLNLENFSEEEQKIISLLENEEKSIDEITREIKIPIYQLSPVLSGLELKNVIINQGNGIFRLK